MTSTKAGMQIDFRADQPESHLHIIRASGVLDVNDNEIECQQDSLPTNFTGAGMQIRGNGGESENGKASTRDSFDPDSNVTNESDLQSEKHLWQIISIEAGMKMEDSEEQPENASASIRVSFDRRDNIGLKS
jgi:hypothetical protein